MFLNTEELFTLLKKKTGHKTIEIIVPWTLMSYDRPTESYCLSFNNFDKNILQLGSFQKFTGHELTKLIQRHLECKSVLLEVKISDKNVLERADKSEWGFLKKIEVNAHITFHDNVIYDNFIEQGMLEFAFLTGDKELFYELTKKNKKDKV